jgi:hypothetical protein
MLRFVLAFVLLAATPLLAQVSEQALQRAFAHGVEAMAAGKAAKAERIFRAMLEHTDSPRVRLELARALYALGKYAEAKALFREVSRRSDTPWRVRDNIEHFVRVIEEKTGYLKLGVTFISDSNPRSIAAQKEFSIGDLRLTPTEAPKKEYGLRYSARGWLPLSETSRLSGYLAASYNDYTGEGLDRLTLDFGGVRPLSDSGWLRGKLGMEAGTAGGQRLYHFPYVGLDAVLGESEQSRLTGEVKAGKVSFADFDHLDADYGSAALSLSRIITAVATVSLGGSVERSSARERPYSYYGVEVGPGISTFWPASAYLVGGRVAVGARKYGAEDPFFGERRSDRRTRLEATLGNKRWRWGDSNLMLVASLERNDSNVEFYSYRKANLSVVVE